MAKYSDEFKLMVVKEYLDGPLGLKLLVRKYDIKSHTQLSNWVNVYQKYGAIGLSRKKKHEIYSVQFKLDVLSFMKRTGASQTETALHFGLTNPPMILLGRKSSLKAVLKPWTTRKDGQPCRTKRRASRKVSSLHNRMR